MAVASATPPSIVTPQSIDSSPSGRISDAGSYSSSSGLSLLAADASSSSPNPPKDLEIQSQASQKSEEYRQLFRLPHDEVLIQDFNCALQENFLLQGHMYVFGHYICFYSNLFGFETKKVIPLHEVTSVRRAKAAGIFPTAIEVVAGEKKYFFTSFLSRDEAFKLINDGLSQHDNGAKEITDMQDTKMEFNTADNGDVIENSNNSKHSMDESDSAQKHKDIPIFEDPKLPLEAEDVIVPSSGVLDNVEEDVKAVVNNDSSVSGSNVAWAEENSDAPKVPAYFTKVAESKFPIRVEEFFNLFYSDTAVGFLESYHGSCGDKDFRCSSWYPHDKFGHARDVSFQHPIKIYFGAKYGTCREVQKFRVYKNSHLVIETSQEVSDVPYGDYFQVEGLWDVEGCDESKESCVVRVYVNVAFSKKTMWKGKIVQTTVEEARDAYAIWIKHAHKLLKQKNIEKEEAECPAADFVVDGQICEANTGEPLSGSQPTHDLKMPQMLPDSKNVNQLVGDSLERTFNVVTSLVSLFRESLVKFSRSLRSQSQVAVLVLITFAVILILMQLSIVVLLTRPQQVQLIPQADYMSKTCTLGERMPETIAWLEKRIQNLKEETLMIETVLEKMRHEHTFLKAQLNDLEQFTRQRSQS